MGEKMKGIIHNKRKGDGEKKKQTHTNKKKKPKIPLMIDSGK